MDKKTILIVDDNADTRLVLSARLNAHHYHTVFAADALQAMSVTLKKRPLFPLRHHRRHDLYPLFLPGRSHCVCGLQNALEG